MVSKVLWKESLKHLRATVEQNSRQSVREMSTQLGVSFSTVSDHLKQMGKIKKFEKSIPHELNEHK